MRGLAGAWVLVAAGSLLAVPASTGAAQAAPGPAPSSQQAGTPWVAASLQAARAATSPTSLPTVRRAIFRCSAWSFVPPSTTTCRSGRLTTASVKMSGTTVWAWSATKRAWVSIAYSWNPVRRRLEVDQAKVRVRPPAVGAVATLWRYTCTSWRLDVRGVTTCSSGRPQRVRARFVAPGGAVQVLDGRTGSFVGAPYRWRDLGGYLTLDALLIPAAAVDLGASMQPRPAPGVRDFVASCPGGGVTANIVARAGGSVVLDGSVRSTSGTVHLALQPGQAVRWILRVPGRPDLPQQARCLPPDFPAWHAARSGTPASEWYLLSPSLGGAAPWYVVVADSWGTPVWWQGTTVAAPIDVQEAPGGLQWTEASFGFSLAALSYRVAWDGTSLGTFGAGLELDDHEMRPTARGTTLAIRYRPRDCIGTGVDCADMTGYGGSAQATIIDAEVVEIDAGGSIVWTWRSRDHLALSEWADLVPADRAPLVHFDRDGHDFWDLVHMNSVEDDGDGFIVSSRHLDAVYRIRKSDGSIDWKLGGTPTPRSLEVLHADRYPLLNNQHDARRLPDGRISVFDNGTENSRPPRVVEIAVDPVARTASVEREIHDSRIPLSNCCGSARRLPNGGYVVSWGGTSFVTETSPAGQPVLTITTDKVFTYRTVPVLPGRLARSVLDAGMDAMHPRPAGG